MEIIKQGQLYKDRYKVIRKIGQGGQATLYMAQDIIKNKTNIVLKFNKQFIFNKSIKEKSKSQAEILIRLQHPNIVKGFEFYENISKDQKYMYLCLVMEYFEGSELFDFLTTLKKKQIYDIYSQIKAVLKYIHQTDTIHRDLTLKNILLNKSGQIKICDFGISSQLKKETSARTINQYATKYYQSPQFCYGTVRKELDLWQLGIVMLQLVTRKHIYEIFNRNHINPVNNTNFCQQIFMKYNVAQEFRVIITPLLQIDYKQRRYSDIPLEMQFQEMRQLNLNLSFKKLTDVQLLNNIRQMQHVFYLNLSNNLLTDSSASSIVQLFQLEKLNMSGNNLTDQFINVIASKQMLQWLTELNMAFTDISDQSIQKIVKHGQDLQSLDISYTKVTQKGIITISNLSRNLNTLVIWSNVYYYPLRFHESIHLNLKQNWNKYRYNNMNINDQCINQLSKLKLNQLTIKLQQTSSVDCLIKNMKQATVCVEIYGNINNQENVQKILKMNKLSKVYLKGVKQYQIAQFKSNELESVALVFCQIKIESLIKCLSGLNQHFDLDQDAIGNQGVNAIANNLKNLTTLHLDQNNIGDQGANTLAKNLINLTTLSLAKNNINEGSKKIVTELKQLKTLFLNYNNLSMENKVFVKNEGKKMGIMIII